MYDDNNIFAKIIRGEIPCKKVYEDDKMLCFHDAYPAAPVHVLAIPKGKYISFDDFSKNASIDEIGHFFKMIGTIANDLSLSSGYRIVTNIGKDGCQSVFHFHVHIMGGTNLKGIMPG